MGAKLVTIDKSVLTPTMPYAQMGFSIGLNEFSEIEPTLKRLEKEKDLYAVPSYSQQNASQSSAVEIIKLLEACSEK